MSEVRPVLPTTPVGRRRRPSGEAPPLPRHVDAATRGNLVLVAATAAFWLALTARPVLVAVTDVDLAILRAVAHLRIDALTPAVRGVNALTSPWVARPFAWATILVLLAFRRFRHLFVYVVVLAIGILTATGVAVSIARMRPGGIEILAGWDGYAQPSLPVARLAVALAGAVYLLVPAGRWRGRALAGAAVVLAAAIAARLYLGVDHPTDAVTALVIGWSLPLVAFRLFAPEDVFPVTYRGGQRAHLEVTGERGDAIVQGLRHQLGLDVVSFEPFGLESSAGSTPLRICVRRDDGGQTLLFGKLYAVSHLRSDRWYKLARTVLYGRLEDEKPFNTVRRLVEYEDHLLRLLRDAGLPTPEPYGFVEITPEREYVVVMQFFEDASELGAATADDAVIDDALRVVARMWEAGVAHRDLKPSNVLVQDGHIRLIDVAFATVRPTPWRQAVDLANMMLTLALSASPERVYERALRVFAPDDIAEAFAASRSVTIPSQLRARIKADGRDLLTRFRELAPERAPVSIQVWSVKRVFATVVALAGVAVGLGLVAVYVQTAGLL